MAPNSRGLAPLTMSGAVPFVVRGGVEVGIAVADCPRIDAEVRSRSTRLIRLQHREGGRSVDARSHALDRLARGNHVDGSRRPRRLGPGMPRRRGAVQELI